MKIECHRDVLTQLRQLPRPVFAAAVKDIVDLAQHPRPYGAVKLIGGGNDWRTRTGECRIAYEIDDRKQLVTVYSVRRRSDTYR